MYLKLKNSEINNLHDFALISLFLVRELLAKTFSLTCREAAWLTGTPSNMIVICDASLSHNST